jgi:4a-hydroxytetrahydrobiopterin dehydratase
MSKVIKITESELKGLVSRIVNESLITEKCWKGYTQKGMKTMFGKKYPNCVKSESVGDTNEASSPAQQAAIAINMKKKGIKPKNESLSENDSSDNKGDWKEVNNKLVKTFHFKDYKGVMPFVSEVMNIANKQNHHPDMIVRYDNVKLSITDHEEGGVSDKCHKFVNSINKL